MNDHFEQSENQNHIRRCHICNYTNEAIKIEECNNCGKKFAPFMFCKDPIGELKPISQFFQKKQSVSGLVLLAEYPPLCGISLYW